MKKIEQLWIDGRKLFTPNTYCSKTYKEIPNEPGIYLIVWMKIDIEKKVISKEILYIGSSANLKERYRSHEVLRVLRKMYDHIRFYFLEENEYLSLEKRLIYRFQPEYNTQWL